MHLPPNKARRSSARQRGAALIAVLWLMGVLALLVFGLAKFVSLDSAWATSLRGEAEARALAESGLALGAHPGLAAGDPVLASENDEGGAYAVRLMTEESRLPLNQLLASGDTATLRRLFVHWGVEGQAASRAADALADWVDTDDLERLNGAERDAYAGQGLKGPGNAPFRSLEEAASVPGMEEVEAARPRWREAFTLWSDGKLNLREAPGDLLVAATGAALPKAEAYVRERAGRDGIEGTEDDPPPGTLPEVLSRLGAVVTPAQMEFFVLEGATRRVESTGRFARWGIRMAQISRDGRLLHREEYPLPLESRSNE